MMEALKNDVTDKALCFLFKRFVENIVVLVTMIFQVINSTRVYVNVEHKIRTYVLELRTYLLLPVTAGTVEVW